jgi:hypothetical protein
MKHIVRPSAADVDVPLPTWGVLRELLTQPDRTAAWQSVAHWTLDVLERELGPSWTVGAVEQFGELPIPLIWAGGHNLAFVQTVELALRLHLLGSIDGFARARKELRGNRELGRVLHLSLQLTIAGLARRLGWNVRLEAGQPPADVEFEVDGRRTTVELRVLGPSDAERDRHAIVDSTVDRIRHAAVSSGVWAAGTTSQVPSDGELERLVKWITDMAAFVRSGGVAPPFRSPVCDLELVKREDARGRRLTTPGGRENLLLRLVRAMNDKAETMRTSKAEWLCIESLTGLFAFTEWGWSAMPAKVRCSRTRSGKACARTPLEASSCVPGLRTSTAPLRKKYTKHRAARLACVTP